MVKTKTPRPGTLDVATSTLSGSKTERAVFEHPKAMARLHRAAALDQLANVRDQARQMLAVVRDVIDEPGASGADLERAIYELYNEASWITWAIHNALEQAQALKADEAAS
jgi:hypothetical protein